MYPQKCNWLVYQKIDNDTYLVNDRLLERTVELSAVQVAFLNKLDGKKDPYAIDDSLTKEQVDSILFDLEFEFLLREDKHKLLWEDGIYIWTVHIPKRRKFKRKVAKVCNDLLMYSVLPVLFVGIFCMLNPTERIVPNPEQYSFWWCLGALLISGGVHEIAHANACLGYGGYVFEYGVMFSGMMPCFYTLMDYKRVKNGFKRLQIIAAGVETHLLIIGASLIVARLFPDIYIIAIQVMIVNVVLAVVNFSFVDTTDGMSIIGFLCFGDERILDKAKRVTRNKRYRKRLYNEGLNGRMKVAVSYMLCATQIIYPLVLAFELMVLLGW